MTGLKSNIVSSILLVAGLAMPASGHEAAGAARDAQSTPVEKLAAPGIENFSRIGRIAGFGGATDPAAMAWLKRNGFSSVINLRVATEPGADIEAARAAARTAELEFIHLPLDVDHPDPDLVPAFIAAVGDPAKQPVYIHCASGTRAAALWMLKRVLGDGWPIDEARAEGEGIALKPAAANAFVDRYLESHSR